MTAGQLFRTAVEKRGEDELFPTWSSLDRTKYGDKFRNDLAVEYELVNGEATVRRIRTLVPYANQHRAPQLPERSRSRNKATPRFVPVWRLKSLVRPYDRPPATWKGLPKSWPDSDTPWGIAKVRNFAKETEDAKRVVAGVDIGEVIVAAAFSRVPPLRGKGKAHEGIAFYARGRLTEQQRAASRSASAALKARSATLGTDRSPENDTKSTARAGELTVHVCARERLLLAGRSRRAHTEACRRAADAERHGAAADLVRHILGGQDAEERAADAQTSVLLYIGKGSMVRSSGWTGPRSGPAIVRRLEIELRRRGVRSMLVRTNECYTSQACPNPDCRDERGQRSL